MEGGVVAPDGRRECRRGREECEQNVGYASKGECCCVARIGELSISGTCTGAPVQGATSPQEWSRPRVLLWLVRWLQGLDGSRRVKVGPHPGADNPREVEVRRSFHHNRPSRNGVEWRAGINGVPVTCKFPSWRSRLRARRTSKSGSDECCIHTHFPVLSFVLRLLRRKFPRFPPWYPYPTMGSARILKPGILTGDGFSISGNAVASAKKSSYLGRVHCQVVSGSNAPGTTACSILVAGLVVQITKLRNLGPGESAAAAGLEPLPH